VPLETIEHKRLYRQVADQLRALIDDGEFAPGARLPAERELAEKFGISRPTIREALIALEVEGRIRIRLGSGIYVAESPPPASSPVQGAPTEGAFEVLHARELIEAAIAGEAALRASEQDVTELQRILDAMATPDQPSADLIRLDRKFHVTIASILGNSFLARVVGELFDQRTSPHYSQLASHFETCRTWGLAAVEHRLILERIAVRDAGGAGQAMRNHLQASAARYSQSFGEAAQRRPPRRGHNRPATSTEGGEHPPRAKTKEEDP
jgi:DNA-binding FadR family transcriptional regulator